MGAVFCAGITPVIAVFVLSAAVADAARVVISQRLTAVHAGPADSPLEAVHALIAQLIGPGLVDNLAAADTVERGRIYELNKGAKQLHHRLDNTPCTAIYCGGQEDENNTFCTQLAV